MSAALISFALVITFLTVLRVIFPSGTRTTAAATHAMTQAPMINYSGNPYRIGAFVYVTENTGSSDDDWCGTFIGMSDGMALIRDTSTHVVTHVNRDQVFSARR